MVAGYLKDFCCNQLDQELKVAEKKYEELQAEAEKAQIYRRDSWGKNHQKQQLARFFGAESDGHNLLPQNYFEHHRNPKKTA